MANKERIYVIGVSDASYHQEELLLAREKIMIVNKENRRVFQYT